MIDFNTSQITEDNSNINTNFELPLFQSIINHGLHNLISSIMTLPMELSFQDLEHLYTQEGDGLWRDDFQGDYSLRQWIAIAFWIILGSVTIGLLIKTHGLAGFSIIYFWVVYAFSIGFSRSSGGRYIVPINWIPMLLLALCCSLIFSRGKIIIDESIPGKLPVWKPIFAMAAFTAFFGSMVLFEKFLPARDITVPEGDLAVLKERLSDQDRIDWDLVETQVKDDTMHIMHGVSIYPRFYYFRDGEHTAQGALMEKDFSRMTFIGINPDHENWKYYQEYLMPHKDLINNFPQDSIYRSISCHSEFGYEDVLAVTIDTLDGEHFTYIRDPLPEFSCPVPEPVCISLENCY